MALKRISLFSETSSSSATLELDLESGFSVLTGETGAGKSILIDALQLVTGARADTGVVREGATRADVSAEFDDVCARQCAPCWRKPALRATQRQLLLRRTVDTQGKSRAWVNGSPATAQQLRAIGEQLLDIHGQHAWQSLTRPDAVRGLLDAYAKVNTQPRLRPFGRRSGAMAHKPHWHKAHAGPRHPAARARAPGLANWRSGQTRARRPTSGTNSTPATAAWPNGQALQDAAQQAQCQRLLDDDDSNALRPLTRALELLQAQAHLEAGFQGPARRFCNQAMAQA